jgi:SAM-dependent methyltransferase
VTVWNGRFEDFAPGSADESLALVAAATAWHWLDPEVRFQKAWSLLRPGGHLAFWGACHVIPEGGDSFFQDIQDVYDEIGEGLPGTYQWLKPGEVPDETAAIRASGLFHPVLVQQFDWETIYSADQYIELLETFSGHLVMSGAQKERLYGAIRDRAGARPDPRIRRHWGAVLHVARRVG